MSGTRLPTTSSYLDLLRTAYAQGREDGLQAADFEPPDGGPSSGWCRARDPADFARHLWDVPGGGPPAGLEVNAPHWYARGFEEALAGRVTGALIDRQERRGAGDHAPVAVQLAD